MLARKEDTIFQPLLKTPSQHPDVSGIPTFYEPPQKEVEIDLGIFSTNRANQMSQNIFFLIKEVDKYKAISFFKAIQF
jgi:hypothetical protein